MKILINLIDDARNDIYVHIDKKVNNFNFANAKKRAVFSNIYFIKRNKVSWGGYSLVQAEIDLLKEASLIRYDYYHLLSGIDLPLKTQDYIHNFFKQNSGKNFIEFDKIANTSRKFIDRVKYFHLFRDGFGRNKNNL